MRDGSVTIDANTVQRVYAGENDKGGPHLRQRQPAATLADDHAGFVTGVTWGHDSATLMVGKMGSPWTSRLWRYDGETWIRGRKFDNSHGSGCLSPDNRKLLVGLRSGDIAVRDTQSGELLSRFLPHSAELRYYTYAPVSKVLATATTGGHLRLWECDTWDDLSSWKPHVEPLGHTWEIMALAFSRDESLLASADENGGIQIWDVATGVRIHNLPGHSSDIYNLAFSPDGTTLASAGFDHSVHLWDVESGEPVRELEGRSWPLSVAFSPDGRLLAAGDSQSIKLWDWKQGQLLCDFHAHWANISHLAFSPDGEQLASSSCDYTVKIWEVDEFLADRDLKPSPVPEAPSDESGTLKVQNDQHDVTVVVSREGFADIEFGEGKMYAKGKRTVPLLNGVYEIRVYRGSQNELIREGSLEIANTTRRIYTWHYEEGGPLDRQRQPAATLADDHAGFAYGVTWAADSATLVAAKMGSPWTSVLWQYDGETWVRGHEFEKSCGSGCLSPDNRKILIGLRPGDIVVRDTQSGELLSRFVPHSGEIRSYTYAPASKILATATTGGHLKLWKCDTWDDLSAWKERELAGHASEILCLAFSPGESSLASAAKDGSVQIWDVASGERIHSLAGHVDEIYNLAFSPDGTTLASAGEGNSVRLWNVETGEPAGELEGRLWPLSVAFSPDGRLLAAGDSQSIKLWDWKRQKLLCDFHAHWANISHLAFSPEGKQLASASSDYSVKIWDVAELLQHADTATAE